MKVKLGARILEASKVIMVADNGDSSAIFMEGGFSFTHNEKSEEVMKKIGWNQEQKKQEQPKQGS
jgi:hypothetical protein